MAKVLVLGGGFAGAIAAERLAEQLGDEHQITLVSRRRDFVFYPALVRLAFGKCQKSDVSFDLRHAMLNHRVNFIEAEVAHFDPARKIVTIAHGEIEGTLSYDYLIFALGRRLATERIRGFFEHAHHLLDVEKALKFGKAVCNFPGGHAVIGHCEGARLPVPVYETAFALSHMFEKRGERDRLKITVVDPDEPGSELDKVLHKSLKEHQIELVQNFPIEAVTPSTVAIRTGQSLDYDLLMLLPPFRGSSAAHYLGPTDDEGYIAVDWTMRVIGHRGIYAAGDCVNFAGPKLGHMAVRQAEVAAVNLAAEIEGCEPIAHYSHEMRLVIDEFGSDSIYFHKDVWSNEPATVRQGRFWSWAKRVQQEYWEHLHS